MTGWTVIPTALYAFVLAALIAAWGIWRCEQQYRRREAMRRHPCTQRGGAMYAHERDEERDLYREAPRIDRRERARDEVSADDWRPLEIYGEGK